MAHALRYFCSWQSERYKHQMRLELWEKDYKGEATAMVLSGEPKLTMEEGETICGASLDFGLLSETNGQYLHLYTTDNHKYLIKILRDGAVMWEGYLLPEYYSEAYIAAPYTVSFTATDWLGMLKNVDFPAEDTRVPILQIIKTCLQYTELPLDFACQLDMRVEGINDTTNVLGALYLNPMTFTGYNCYEVLEKILAAFNATLRQTGHRWLISSIDDELPLRLISWDSLTYTGDGESNNGELIGTNFAGTFIDGSMTMAIEPAKKSVDLSQDIFYRESWLKDYDFRSADAWAWPDSTNIVKPGLAYYIQDGVLIEQISVEYLILRTKSTHELPYLSQVINVEGAPDDSEYTLGIKFFTPNLVDGDNITALWVKIINRSSSSLTQDVAYLSKDGWTNEDSYIELNGTSAEPKYISTHTYNRGGRQYLIYDKENWPTTKINFISIPYSGTLEIRIYPMYLAGFTNVINPSYYETYFGGVYLTKTNVTKNLTISSTLNPDAAETASSVNLMLCDSPEKRNVELGVLNYFSLSDGTLTTGKKWYYNNQEYEDFLHAITYSYSRCYANKRQKLSGALYTDKIYNLCSFTDKWSGKRHTIKSWIYSIISERLDSMEIIETPAKEIELTLSTPEAGSSNKQNQPSGGTSGGGSTSMAGSGRYVNLDTAQEVSGEKTWNDNANFKKNINVAGDGIFGGEVVAIAGDAEPAGVTNYAQLQGKPSINGKELASGDNTLDALGIQPKGDYTTASQLATTLENYATKVFVSNNYASKSAVNTIQALIPATASADNQLADKDFVNSSIATATAEFRGSFTSLDELKATSGNLNDYAFYLHTDSVGNSIVDRYKWTTAGWLYEYTLNNSSFTAEQWAALNSAITATLVQSYNSHLTNSTIHITAAERSAWNAKWTYNEETIKAVKVNAAISADKLATARKIWGTPFDGTGNVDGGITIRRTWSVGSYTEGIRVVGASNEWCGLFLGTADATAGVETTQWNILKTNIDTLRICRGSSNSSFLEIKPNGNVLIGTITDNGYKLQVNGKGHYSDDLIVDGEVVAVAGEGTPAGVTDYSALTGKPSINGVTLVSGNNTLAALGIQAAGDYATNSGVTTLLANYADKTFVSNNYVSKSAFNNHTADTDIHITASERTAWNSKWDYDEATIKAVKVTSASSADSVAWSGISGKPSTFTPSSHTHTASEISGLPTKLSAFTNDVGYVSVRHKNGYSYNNLYTLYKPGTSSIYRIDLTSVQVSIWAMLFIEVSLNQMYNNAYGGKILINAYHNTTNTFSGFNATILGTLQNIKVYGSDGRYIYINASMSYSTISIDRVLVGDNAVTADLSNITIERVDSLPDTYQTAGICNGLHTGNFTKSLVEGVLTGNITSHTHSYLPLTGGTLTGTLVCDYNLSNQSHYTWRNSRQHSGEGGRADNFIILQKADGTFNASFGTYGDGETDSYIYIGYKNFNGSNLRISPTSISWGDNRILHSGNYNSYSPTLTGTGASGTWGISITGNAASATKLQTQRTIWGQSFDGSGDVSGGIRTCDYIQNNDQAGGFFVGSRINGLGDKAGGLLLYVYGQRKMSFYTNEANRMEISTNGNVLIGTVTDNGYKLQVNGSERVYGDLIVDGEVSALVA